MKNTTIFIAIGTILVSFFSSCNQPTGVSLTKRHYMNGYNLEISSKQAKPSKPTRFITSNILTPEIDRAEQTASSSLGTSGENYIKQDQLSFLNNESGSSQNSTSRKGEIYVKHNGAVSKIVSSIKMVAKKPFAFKQVFPENKISVRHDGDVRGGGGLIWTIIVVLLVLWLLSLLTGGWGLGGLLYIFLVVALILILLRLLRII
jgi:hemin uptake protein HemP